MTLTMQIVKLLADGVPRTSEEIVAALGQSRVKVRNALVIVRMQDWAISRPVVYMITPVGVVRSGYVPTTNPVKLARQAREKAVRKAVKLANAENKEAVQTAQARARIAARSVERDPEEIAALAEESIRSVRFTPNSVFNLGMR